MKSHEDKTEFIRMRAEGMSYTAVSSKLNISKSTCSQWERELKDEIYKLKHEKLNELYESYHMTKEGRVQRLGNTLNRINDALAKVDLSTLSPEKLLNYNLKYLEILKKECSFNTPPYKFSDNYEDCEEETIELFCDMLNRYKAGLISAEQAKEESNMLYNIRDVYGIDE